MHGFFEIDRIQHFDFIRLVNHFSLLVPNYLSVFVCHRRTSRQQMPHFHEYSPFGVCHNIRTVHLHKVGFYKETCLAGTGTADYQNIFVSGILWLFRSAGHHQPFCFRQDDIFLKHRVNIRLNVLFRSPSGGTILHTLPVFLCIFCPVTDNQLHSNTAQNTVKYIHVIETRNRIFKRPLKIIECFHALIPRRSTGTDTVQPAYFVTDISK